MKPAEGRSRVVIEDVTPQLNGGRYPVYRILGDQVTVSAAVFADGHDMISARLLYRRKSERRWRFVPMTFVDNDLWTASFEVSKLGSWSFTVQGRIDHFETWVRDLRKRLEAQPSETNPNAPDQNIPLALRTGALLLEQAAKRARSSDAAQLTEVVSSLRWMADQNAAFYEYPITDGIRELVARYPDLDFATKAEPELTLWVNRERARFSTWYELFPRSASKTPGKHGTLKDVQADLPEIAAMGFDILYMPPIHPIGSAYRKGKNNATSALEGDVGSPWAIGAARTKTNEGGHKAIHPELGTHGRLRRTRSRCAQPSTWSLRSTSPFSARPITPGSSSTRRGSSPAPTAPFNMRKTRPRSTRTSIPSTSNPPTGARSGTS